ncbi:putative cardiolipin synthase CMP-forming [Taenia crassiceps]|uniref:cardiolipin synthase (CMP-forming) n=1 Tax=Taenia crassiceps TaxID=6207 RepID=A0ABR4QDR6_9CEST
MFQISLLDAHDLQLTLEMSALASVDIQRLARLSIRHFIFNSGLKLSNHLHATHNLRHIKYFSSKPRAKIITIPNILTSIRIGATPLIVSLTIKQDFLSAAILAAVIGLTDAADGYIARRFPSQQSVAGSYLDPLADKLFISSLSLASAYSDLLPGSFAVLITLHSLLPKEEVIEMKPISSSKLNTAVQITAVFSSLVAPLLDLQDSPALSALWHDNLLRLWVCSKLPKIPW